MEVCFSREGLSFPPWYGTLLNFLQGLHFKDVLKGEGCELVTITIIELGLELHPVKPESVQEGTQSFHQQQDGYSQVGPDEEYDEEANATCIFPKHCQAHVHDHGP